MISSCSPQQCQCVLDVSLHCGRVHLQDLAVNLGVWGSALHLVRKKKASQPQQQYTHL